MLVDAAPRGPIEPRSPRSPRGPVAPSLPSLPAAASSCQLPAASRDCVAGSAIITRRARPARHFVRLRNHLKEPVLPGCSQLWTLSGCNNCRPRASRTGTSRFWERLAAPCLSPARSTCRAPRNPPGTIGRAVSDGGISASATPHHPTIARSNCCDQDAKPCGRGLARAGSQNELGCACSRCDPR